MTPNKTNITQLKVDGMTCANCALGIHKTLENHGFKDVMVDFTTGDVEFSSVPEGQSPEKLIEQMGYSIISDDQIEKKFWTIERKFYFSLIFSVPLFMHMFVSWHVLHSPWVQLALCVPVFVLGALHFGRSAWGSLKNGVPNMDVLIILGATAAFAYSLAGAILQLGPDYLFFETASTIISLVLLGNVIEKRSVKQTGVALRELMALKPEKAIRVARREGKEVLEEIDFQRVTVGDVLEVNLGDKIPVDGKILSGNASVDESALTGESMPVEVTEGSRVLGGSPVISGNVRMVAQQVGNETVIARVIDLVKSAQRDKPQIQQLGDKISAIFVPVVVTIALLTFVISYFVADIGIRPALMSAVAVLVISCPCAMGLATPTAVAVGVGRSAKEGILIKGGSVLENFSSVKKVFFDKTGTLTTGNFTVTRFEAIKGEGQELKSLIKSLEMRSGHPIANSLVKAFADVESRLVMSVEEIKGKGMRGMDENQRKLEVSRASGEYGDFDGQLTIDGEVCAVWKISDEIKPGMEQVISYLHNQGIETLMLSGDKQAKCDAVAKQLGIKSVFAEQLPDEKLAVLEKSAAGAKIAMVGDGVNDAPSLARATVGISLGNASKIAMDAAGVILLKDDPHQLVKAFELSRQTLKTIKQNLFWAFSYNIIAIPIAALGMLNPMVAALSMAFSDVMVIGNSLRLKVRKIG